MDSAVAILRLFGPVLVCLALGSAFFVRHLGTATAVAGARAAARSVAAQLPDDWDCQREALGPEAEATAATAAISRTRQLSALRVTDVSVDVTSSCGVVVGVSVSAASRVGVLGARAVACAHRRDVFSELVVVLREC